MKQNSNTIILGIAIILTAIILGNAYKSRTQKQGTITVTGLGKKDFISDLIVWSGSFMRKNLNLKDAYATLDKDRETIREYLISKGIKAENIVFSSVNINKDYEDQYDKDGNRTGSDFTGYTLTQSVQIESGEVDKIEEISRKVTELINSGVEFYSNKPQYYYTKLAELKVEMIAEATRDAYARAQKIAENAGGDVGSLTNASMGVFQITAQNSSEDYSWGGSYNTYAKKKTAAITIRLEYEVD